VRRLQIASNMETKTPKTILIATDFSDGGDEALDRAVEIAKPSGAEVEILHVIELAEELPVSTFSPDADYGALYLRIDKQLSDRADRIIAAGVPCTTKIIEGSAVADITKRARDIGAEVIVVGTHGRTGLAHAMLGSVAERIVRRASCPVLTVPFSKRAAA
jgi:nucleotide-binding universal stress UspA family protein